MKSGLGIRSALFQEIERTKPDFGFLEAHSENYFGDSLARTKLVALREHYPISLHGVGLSLGRADRLSNGHLNQLRSLVNEIDPLLVSEHLAWSAFQHRQVPDLLPLPLDHSSLQTMCEHVDQLQEAIGRQVLIENPSNYLLFDLLQIPEAEFLNLLSEKTGCGLLVDVNNVYVSAHNIGRDPHSFIDALLSKSVKQYHLAGHTAIMQEAIGGQERVLIDTHNQSVAKEVWALFQYTLKRHGCQPTLLEWDSDFPELGVLVDECERTNKILSSAADALKVSTKRARAPLPASSVAPPYQAHFIDAVLGNDAIHTHIHAEFQHRIGIYRNNVKSALHDYLAEVYPATRGVVGEGFFRQIAYFAIQSSPPSDGNIHAYGSQLSTVIPHFEGLTPLVYLADLMELEWAIHSTYYSASTVGLDPSSIDQAELLTAPVALRDGLHLVVSNYPLYEIYRQSLPDYNGDVDIRLEQSQDAVLVYKDDHSVAPKLLDAKTATLLLAIQESENLLQAISHLEGSMSAEQLSIALTKILEQRLLVLL